MLKSDTTEIIESIYNATLSPELFTRFTQFIQQRCGIHIVPSKQTMLEGRLRKRMRHLMLPTFEEYARFLFHHSGNASDEIIHFLDAITTNKTGFFREAPHLDYLASKILPEFMQQHEKKGPATFRIWSAGCSSGEEPYSLTMLLNEFAEENPAFSYAMLATDLSRRALERAKNAIYDIEQLEDVPPEYRRKYFIAARTGDSRKLRVIDALRKNIMFRRLNFMDTSFPIRDPLHVIFCRNVIMYFDRTTRAQLVQRFTDNLIPGGHLFTGHSESLTGFHTGLKSVSSSVYQKPRH
jgi:chemotaxis protein methyltransferase CheR